MTKDQPSQQFDWGPPAGGLFESVREWLVYPVLLVLIIGAGWALIDTDPSPERDSRPRAAGVQSGPVGPRDGQAIPPVVPPVGALPIERPAPAGVADSAGPAYYVQLGAFADETGAREMFRKAEIAGYPASMSVPDEHYDMYRLLMGPYATEQEAEQWSRKLQDLDFPSFVIESL